MKKYKQPPRTLFKRKKDFNNIDVAGFQARLKNHNHNQIEEVKRNIEKIKSDAEFARSNSVPNGSEHADRIGTHLQDLSNCIDKGSLQGGILAAMRATQCWMELRADAFFAKAVREKEKRESGEGFATKRPNCETIIKALKNNQSQKAAAASLGVAPKTLRTWLGDTPSLLEHAQWTTTKPKKT